MPGNFTPKFNNFQKDIEAYITSIGKREKDQNGFVIYRGYFDAQRLMFERYFAQESYEPLVSHFRKWNWEYSYDDFLLRLTDALLKKRSGALLMQLWAGVISKRRKLYNDIWKFEKRNPGVKSQEDVIASKMRLLDSLDRASAFSIELDQTEETLKYSKMKANVEAGRMA